MEKSMILRAMEHVGGGKSGAAQLLKLGYTDLLSKLKEYGSPGICIPCAIWEPETHDTI